MKKNLLIIATICLLITGCGSNEEKEMGNTTNESTTTITTASIEDTTTTKKTTKSTSTTITESCKKKKFKNKYTYTYKDEATCKKQGESDYYELYDKGVDAMLFGCEEIVDDCGDNYWGLYLLSCPNDSCKFYY